MRMLELTQKGTNAKIYVNPLQIILVEPEMWKDPEGPSVMRLLGTGGDQPFTVHVQESPREISQKIG